MLLESEFQKKFKERLLERYPGAIYLKNDPNYLQGFPDSTILINGHCFVLETKREPNSPKQKNQAYYVDHINQSGGYARFVRPENADIIFEEIVGIVEGDFRHEI